MTQPTCEHIMEAIHKLTQDLYTIEDQIQAIEVAGMYQLIPGDTFYNNDRLTVSSKRNWRCKMPGIRQ